MTTQFLLTLLKEYKNHFLYFQYAPQQFVPNNYHITEVKNTSIDSVDCGGQTDHWKETIIQLWESTHEASKERPMTTFKALSILNKVAQFQPFEEEAIIKFEYGNDQFHTAQLQPEGYTVQGQRLIINLSPSITDCKAKETCGIPEPNKEEVLENVCTPGSGCC